MGVGFIAAQALAVEFHILEFLGHTHTEGASGGIANLVLDGGLPFHMGFVKEDTIDNFRAHPGIEFLGGDIERPAERVGGHG